MSAFQAEPKQPARAVGLTLSAVTPDFIERVQRAALSGEDVLCGPPTSARFWLFIMLREIVIFRGLQGMGAVGCEMQLEARALVQPGSHLGCVVDSIVVQGQMDIAPRGLS